jgi:hypothetical protein
VAQDTESIVSAISLQIFCTSGIERMTNRAEKPEKSKQKRNLVKVP